MGLVSASLQRRYFSNLIQRVRFFQMAQQSTKKRSNTKHEQTIGEANGY